MESVVVLVIMMGMLCLGIRNRGKIWEWLKMPSETVNDGYYSSLGRRKVVLKRKAEDANAELEYLENIEKKV